MGEVVEYLYNKPTGKDGKIIIDDKIKADIENYYKEYGAK
jgi:orotate phosphoribosyltransferase